ncbi:Endothelin-converting enzyme 2 [Galdieria sulphuraria]|nr:Endothelin-converting enzyme 2 [Galdieria sulphuraria]
MSTREDEPSASGTVPLLGEDTSEVGYESYHVVSTRSKIKRLLPVLTVIFGTSFLVAGLIFVAFPGWFWKNSPSQTGGESGDDGGETVFSQGEDQSQNSLATSIVEAMDSRIDPCEDFYRYACGGWLNRTSIPPDRSSYGKSFTVLTERIEATLRNLLEGELYMGRTKTGKLYYSCMNMPDDSNSFLQYLNLSYYSLVKDLSDSRSIANLTALFHSAQISVFFEASVAEDLLDPTKYSFYFSQGGLSLPSREYYLEQSTERKKIRSQYLSYIKDLFNSTLLHTKNESEESSSIFSLSLEEAANEILLLETVLANISRPLADLRDPNISYNPVPITLIPQYMHIEAYLSVLGVDPSVINNIVVIDSVEFFAKLSEMMNTTPVDTIKAYMTFHALNSLVSDGMLGESLYDKYFDFYGRKIAGQKEKSPRWRRCLSYTNSGLGDLLGMAFVEQNFSSSRKESAENMLRKIEASFAVVLRDSPWLSEEVKSAAAEKLREVNNKIGYSESPDTYDDVEISNDNFFLNSLSIRLHGSKKALQKLGKPVDKKEWLMTPQTVNAYYNPSQNEMVFPAAILQIPFFSEEYPAAVNFGGLGSVMGHELSHGFDDQGQRAQCVSKLYSSFYPSELSSEHHVNGV